MNIKENLKFLYNNVSKHSNYQILPDSLKNYINPDDLQTKSRYEKERLDFILDNINSLGKSILDIGGNTGYFSFELLSKGAKDIIFIEGNKLHTEFVKEASIVLGLKNKIIVKNKYFQFSDSQDFEKVDITLLLNVLHHVGDDFGDNKLSIEQAKLNIIENINFMGKYTDILVLQIGFCWKGNRNYLLFENGTKEEMIDFIESGINQNWNVLNIGIPEMNNGIVEYNNLNKNNIKRDDSLGEFLNRPIFILVKK